MFPTLFRHRTTRFVVTTAAQGSFTDWTLFATMVVTVDGLTGGSPWATALVLLSRILPGIVFAPFAARRVDRSPLGSTLRRHELLRVAGVALVAGGFWLRSIPIILVSILVLEFAAAMQAAAREALISRHVPRPSFTAVNTTTAVLSYGLLPVGALVVGAAGASSGWLLALAGYGTLALRYRTLPPLGTDPAAARGAAVTDAPEPTHVVSSRVSLWRTVLGATLGLLPVVALFTVAPDLAERFVGDRAATGVLFALVLAGGGLGFAATNWRGTRPEAGMTLAAAGLGSAAADLWQVGLVMLGAGAGIAYLGLQTRLQHQASDPSQFAGAFAVLKMGSGVAALAAPVVISTNGPVAMLTLGVVAALVALVVVTDPRWVLQRPLRWLLLAVVRVEVTNPEDRVPGPAVVVSNHPHWLDGAVTKLADETLRPIARWQRPVLVRAALWLGDCVVTTARTDRAPRPAYEQAADHLRAGGRIWLAPEGGSHQDRELRRPRSGAVRMAHAAGIPIQPLAIRWVDHPHAGPDLSRWRPWRRPAVELTWGRPVTPTGQVEIDGHRMMVALSAATGMPYSQPLAAAA